MDTPIKVTNGKTLLHSKLFDVVEKKIQYPGITFTHETVQFNEVATIFPVADNGDIYLIHQYRYLFDAIVLGAIAGHIDKGETPMRGAKRELEEETGIRATQWEKLATIDMARSGLIWKQHLFLAKGLTLGTAHPEQDEHIELVRMSVKEAVQAVLTGKITHAASIIGILLIDKL